MQAAKRSSTRAVTFFIGSRDHYQLPLALAERDWLETFVTELYWPLEHPILGPLARRVLGEPYRSKRHAAGLSSTKVTIQWSVLAALAAYQLRPALKNFRTTDRMLGECGRRIAAATGSAVFSYSYYAHAAFEDRGPDRPRHRFIFQVHPHPRSVRRILQEELERYPWAADSLLREEELGPHTRRFEELCEEPALANGWAAASNFTAQTLAENGIPRDSIHVIPYGVDTARFPTPERPRSGTGKLEVVFIGSMIQRKGLCDLLEAMRLLRTREVHLTLAGRGFVDRRLLEHYRDVDFDVREGLDHPSLVRLMHESDLFAFPSLVEGFGHVVVESMSTGLPVLTTAHTCAAELIEDGVHGWIVPIRSPRAVADRLTWAAEHRADLSAMGEAAAGKARELTWQRFREGIAAAYQAMLSA